MLGHTLLTMLSMKHEVRCTLRRSLKEYQKFGIFTPDNVHSNVDALATSNLVGVFEQFKPDAVVNCIGIIKQKDEAKSIIPSLEVNALFPHKLVNICKSFQARLIHLSTDCVFNGKKGNYTEDDPSDAEDIYGKTKFLGEVDEGNCLTLRTSIVGRELTGHLSLLEWFLSEAGPVKGFKNAIFSGFSTREMSRIIERLLVSFPKANGVYQVSSAPINKYDLLNLFKEKLGHNIQILPDEVFHCDRTLDSSRFRREFDYTPPSWQSMGDDFIV